MAEQVGTLLWELRTAAGWSLGKLAQRAGVSKAALSQWESGKRQPRVPELEATLDALGATAAQRARLFACIEAPRALRLLQSAAEPGGLGAPPSAGDLLRALRLRGGWTQEQVAQRLGVGQNTVARWERGERLPSTEQMQALCFALEAREPELVALTTGRFAESQAAWPLDTQTIMEHLNSMLYTSHTDLADLNFILAERWLWQRAAQEPQAQELLAAAYAAHAHYLSLYQRWEEITPLARRVLALTPKDRSTPDYTLRAVLKLAAAEVYGGNRPAPERGLHRLKAWLPHSSDPDYTAWMLSDMGKYLVLAGQTETAVELGKKAVRVTVEEHDMRTMDLGRLLVATGHPGQALDQMAALPEHTSGMFVYQALVRCEAYLALCQPEEASAWLERIYAVIEEEGLEYDRLQADALAQRL